MNWIRSFPRLIACSVMQNHTPIEELAFGSLNGSVAVVTGGNSGIGYETAKSLAKQGCEVFIMCRSIAKSAPVAEEINQICSQTNSKGSCILICLDLSDLESVKTGATELRKLLGSRKIDIFACNGGIMMQPYSKSPQGHEIHFATNHLGHFALVGTLLDILIASKSRVVVITGDIAVLADDASPDYEYTDMG